MGQVANNFGTSIWVLRLHFKLNEKIRTHFWDSLMKVEEYFLCFGSFLIKDGSLIDSTEIRSWETQLRRKHILTNTKSLDIKYYNRGL